MDIFKPAYFELTPESLAELLQEIRNEKAKVTAKISGTNQVENSDNKSEDEECGCVFCSAFRQLDSDEQEYEEVDLTPKELSSTAQEINDFSWETKLKHLYPKYHKDVSDLDTIDIYKIHELFEINDPSGRIHHASKKLLLAGSRNGGKDKFQDIREARDTLDSWLVDNS